MLLTRPGELVTRDELRASCGPGYLRRGFDTGLNVVVNKIRNVLGDSASQPRLSRPCHAVGSGSLPRSRAPLAGCRRFFFELRSRAPG